MRSLYNPFLESEWGMTHKGNLLAKTGFKNIEWVQSMFAAHTDIYNTFTEKIMSQIHQGICHIENEKYSTPKNAVMTRFNTNLFPRLEMPLDFYQ